MTTPNKSQGTIHAGKVEYSAGPPLKKRDCEEVKTRVQDAEKSMSWFQYIATQNDSWRNPWVIFAKFNECKRLPPEIDSGAYTQLRDKLQAYDNGEIKMSGEDAMELRRTVKLVQDRYDNVPSPYITMPADYISPAEQEVYDRFGNNMTMALAPATIPGIAGTRMAGGTEAQARAGGELSAQMFGFMGFKFMQKHGLLKNNPQPQNTTREKVNGATLEESARPGIVKQTGLSILGKPVKVKMRTAEDVNAEHVAKGNDPPYKKGTTVIEREAQVGEKFDMVIDAKQKASIENGDMRLGGWATTDSIPNQSMARDALAIKTEYKPDLGYVARIEVTQPGLTIREGIAGPQGALGGGSNQIELVTAPANRGNYFDVNNIKPLPKP
jgi:hypothetical protein